MLTLEFTQLGGMVEAYRLDQVATFGVIFTEVRKQLDETKAELLEPERHHREADRSGGRGPAHRRRPVAGRAQHGKMQIARL